MIINENQILCTINCSRTLVAFLDIASLFMRSGVKNGWYWLKTLLCVHNYDKAGPNQ